MQKDPTYEFKYWRVAAWNGPLFMAVFMIFWGMFFNYPPMAGSLTADQVAAVFREHPNLFRTGMVVCMTFAISYAVWAVSVSKIMAKSLVKTAF
ncbi:MAG: hypothetical protein AB9917_23880 [Negativicutes bacterium]